jgi:hypothetical protein
MRCHVRDLRSNRRVPALFCRPQLTTQYTPVHVLSNFENSQQQTIQGVWSSGQDAHIRSSGHHKDRPPQYFEHYLTVLRLGTPSPVLNRAVIDLHGPIVCSRPNEDLAQRERSRVRIAVSKLCFVFLLLLLRGRQ